LRAFGRIGAYRMFRRRPHPVPARPARTSHRRLALAGDRGFTMIEILCVMLILAILTAIAVPAFINQRQKGEDTEAARTIATAATTLASEHVQSSTYDLTAADLVAMEPSLARARALTVSGTESTYTISERSDSGTLFTLRHAGDAVLRTCSSPGHGLCKATPDAAGNRW
jgi:type IV pilus assembly protein PilA